ncbi:MAG: AMP phosphorylase [Candidatus Norongarragalinales archaeon]
MELKAAVFDIEQGQNEIVLSEDQAKQMDLGIMDRVKITLRSKSITAMVDVCVGCVPQGTIGVFREVADALKAKNGDRIKVEVIQRPSSLDLIRKKLDGGILSEWEIASIIRDLNSESLSQAELAAFIAGIYTRGLNTDETVALTKAIYSSGEQLHFKSGKVVSEHSIGGVAGDRVSMILVPIMASLGFVIPKTCSRAISSAAGTADVMEVLAPVALPIKKVGQVVKKTGGCLVWGGALNMASADDKLIKIRNPLRLDPKPLLLSSILAKKKAEGAKFVLIDLPVGKGAKLNDVKAAKELAADFSAIGSLLGMKVESTITDGSGPLVETIGPVLEARTVLETLSNQHNHALLEKACSMSGILLSMVKGISREEGYKLAKRQVLSGKALEKFRQILQAQGGDPNVTPESLKPGKYKHIVKAGEEGRVEHIDNRAISRVCRALGAPKDKKAGMIFMVSKGEHVDKGDVLFEMYAERKEKIDFALEQLKTVKIIEVERVIIDVV